MSSRSTKNSGGKRTRNQDEEDYELPTTKRSSKPSLKLKESMALDEADNGRPAPHVHRMMMPGLPDLNPASRRMSFQPPTQQAAPTAQMSAPSPPPALEQIKAECRKESELCSAEAETLEQRKSDLAEESTKLKKRQNKLAVKEALVAEFEEKQKALVAEFAKQLSSNAV